MPSFDLSAKHREGFLTWVRRHIQYNSSPVYVNRRLHCCADVVRYRMNAVVYLNWVRASLDAQHCRHAVKVRGMACTAACAAPGSSTSAEKLAQLLHFQRGGGNHQPQLWPPPLDLRNVSGTMK